MSETKKQEVYAAISDSIMDLRLSLNKSKDKIDPLAIDGDLFKLEITIWRRIKIALKIDEA